MGGGPCYDGVFDGSPFGAGIVRGFNAYDDTRIFFGHFGGRGGLHVRLIVFILGSAHTGANDIEESEDASFGTVDDVSFEILEIFVAGGACVGNGGNAIAEGEAVGEERVIACVGTLFPGAGVNVDVDVDEARGDVQAHKVDGFEGAGRIDGFGDFGDLAFSNRDVVDGAEAIPGIDEVTVFEKQIILCWLGAGAEAQGQQQGEFHACQDISHGGACQKGGLFSISHFCKDLPKDLPKGAGDRSSLE